MVKIVYCVDNGSKVNAQQNPARVNSYLMPARTTTIAPPNFDSNTQTASFDGSSWIISEIPVEEQEEETNTIQVVLTPMELLRAHRDGLLSQTDWRMLEDYPNDDKEVWKTYRQQLRDITIGANPQIDENGELVNITWPTPPQLL